MKELIYYVISASTLIAVGKRAVIDIVEHPSGNHRECITTRDIVTSYDVDTGDFETNSARFKLKSQLQHSGIDLAVCND